MNQSLKKNDALIEGDETSNTKAKSVHHWPHVVPAPDRISGSTPSQPFHCEELSGVVGDEGGGGISAGGPSRKSGGWFRRSK